MKKPFSKTITFLVILLGLALLVGGSCTAKKTYLLKKKQKEVLKAYKENVTESIDNNDRDEQLIDLGEDLYRHMKRDTKTLLKLVEDLDALNRGYNTTREELEAGFNAINDLRRQLREKILSARVRAEALTTPKEWQELTGRNRTLMDLIQETPGLL
jgi:hypothetical protein